MNYMQQRLQGTKKYFSYYESSHELVLFYCIDLFDLLQNKLKGKIIILNIFSFLRFELEPTTL